MSANAQGPSAPGTNLPGTAPQQATSHYPNAATGTTGSKGSSGSKGTQGASGTKGTSGPKGTTGNKGTSGTITPNR